MACPQEGVTTSDARRSDHSEHVGGSFVGSRGLAYEDHRFLFVEEENA